MRLILIRHGQTPANVTGTLDTLPPGPGLTELGQEQARALPAALADRGIEAIFVSNLVRTHLTAQPLVEATGIGPVEQAGLAEIEAGDLEDRRDKLAIDDYLSVVVGWAGGLRDVRIPGGPDGHEFFARYDRAIGQVVSSGVEVAAAFSHGAAIRVWAGGTATNLDETFIAARHLENTGIVTLDGDPESGWRCIDWEGEPVGGEELTDRTAQDPTGERI